MSKSLRKRVRRACAAGLASGAALMILAAGQASAATYGSSTFNGGAEGWREVSSECKTLNQANLPLLCTASSGYDGTAGAPPGSYAVKTSIPVNAIGSFESHVVAESPTFTASGTGAGSLSLARSFTPGGLLPLTPKFTYDAYLVDKTTNTKQKAITDTVEAEAPFATKAGGVSLVAGHNYAVQIEAATTSTVAAAGLVGGELVGRFDNVAVTGPGEEGSGGRGGSGGEGGGRANGSGGVSAARLESLMRSSLIGPAVLHGSKLTVKAACPKKVGATCTVTLRGMLNRHKAATTARKAKIKKGKKKQFALKVKPAARKKVKAKKKLLFKETVKAGKAHVTVWKSLKLVRK